MKEHEGKEIRFRRIRTLSGVENFTVSSKHRKGSDRLDEKSQGGLLRGNESVVSFKIQHLKERVPVHSAWTSVASEVAKKKVCF